MFFDWREVEKMDLWLHFDSSCDSEHAIVKHADIVTIQESDGYAHYFHRLDRMHKWLGFWVFLREHRTINESVHFTAVAFFDNLSPSWMKIVIGQLVYQIVKHEYSSVLNFLDTVRKFHQLLNFCVVLSIGDPIV